ncbi:MAG: hypothetical protein D6805_01950 [Planctomycetota bacterium]|nr:MAG: hypothetical protein D6805_01950 [Planctomycetota bacterium]
MSVVFWLYPLLLAGILGLWWVPFFLWREDARMRRVSGILLWWVNIPLYALMFAPGLERDQVWLFGYLSGWWYELIRWLGFLVMVGGILATVLFFLPRIRAGGPGYDAKNLQIRGIYGWMRHPQLAGAWFIALGWSLWQGALYALVSVVGYLVVLRLHAEMEERYLLLPVFGEEYERYRRRVRSFVPFVF